jgi:hypothetical protein
LAGISQKAHDPEHAQQTERDERYQGVMNVRNLNQHVVVHGGYVMRRQCTEVEQARM